MDKKMLKREFTTVTPFSKAVALGLFILLPILAFYWGTLYQHVIDATQLTQYVASNSAQRVGVIQKNLETISPVLGSVSKAPTATPNPAPAHTKRYMSRQFGFSFDYPDYLVYDNSSSADFVGLLQKQDALMVQRMHVQVFSGTDSKSLEQLATEQNTDSSFPGFHLNHTAAVIHGHEALIISGDASLQQLCNWNGTNITHHTVATFFRAPGYVVLFWANNSCDTYQTDWFEPIPLSVVFR